MGLPAGCSHLVPAVEQQCLQSDVKRLTSKTSRLLQGSLTTCQRGMDTQESRLQWSYLEGKEHNVEPQRECAVGSMYG